MTIKLRLPRQPLANSLNERNIHVGLEALLMSNWINLKIDTVATAEKEDGMEISVSPSPYDVPGAIKADLDENRGRLRGDSMKIMNSRAAIQRGGPLCAARRRPWE